MSRKRRKETEEQRARRELISDFLSAANIQSMDDIQELFKEALAGFMEGSLESEYDSELGFEPYDFSIIIHHYSVINNMTSFYRYEVIILLYVL